MMRSTSRLCRMVAWGVAVGALCRLDPVSAQEQPEAPIAERLVQVLVAHQAPNAFRPWQNATPGHRSGYAIRIGDSLYVTTESLVRNHTLVEIRRARTGTRLPVTVLMSDDQVGLALLSTDGVATNPPSLRLVETLNRNDTVDILQFDDTGELQRGEGHVLQISFDSLPAAPYATLVFSLLTDLNVNGEGAPVLQGDRLAGLMVSYDPSTRTGRMLPYPVLRRFLKDATQPPYTGVAIAGFASKPLIDPAHRDYLGAGVGTGGILILSCIPGTGASESLKPNDVILKWDGYAVDELGYYDDPDFGRIKVSYLIQGRRSVGDSVPARIVRDRAEQTLNVRLSSYSDSDALIPENVHSERPDYLIEGGLVLRELDGAYLRAHGGKWQSQLDQRLVSLYLTRQQAPERKGQRIVVLAGVMPDPINVGYQHFRNHEVTQVNGKPIDNMTDVFRIVEKDGHVRRLRLRSMGVDLVLDETMLKEANARLASLYQIPNLRYRRPK